MSSRRRTPGKQAPPLSEVPQEPKEESPRSKALRLAASHMTTTGDLRSAVKILTTQKEYQRELANVKKHPEVVYQKKLYEAKMKWVAMFQQGGDVLSYFTKELKAIKIKRGSKEIDINWVTTLIEVYRNWNEDIDNVDEIGALYVAVFEDAKMAKKTNDLETLMNAVTGGDYSGAYLLHIMLRLHVIPKEKRMTIAELLRKNTTRQERVFIRVMINNITEDDEWADKLEAEQPELIETLFS